MSRLGARILAAHYSIRAVVIFDKDSEMLDSASRNGKQHPIEIEGPLYDNDGNARIPRVLFEVSKMLSTTLGASGRVVFHWNGGQLLGLRVGTLRMIIDASDGASHEAIEAGIRKILER